MPTINRTAILDALVGQRVLFIEGLEGLGPDLIASYADTIQSDGPAEQHNFTGGIPGMREWLGDRVVHNLEGKSLTVVNRDYELTLGIPRNDYEDDKLGLWAKDVRMLGRRTAQHPNKLLVDLLNDAFVTTGAGGAAYDGVPFFSVAHPRSGRGLANQSNKGTAALAADGVAFQAGITALRALTDDHGEPLDFLDEGVEIDLVVPPALESVGKALVEAEFNASGGTNTNYGRANLKVLNRLTSSTAWFLAVRGLPIRPFIHQRRRDPELVVQNMPNDDTVFTDRLVKFGVDGRYAMAYGAWQLMYGSDGTS